MIRIVVHVGVEQTDVEGSGIHLAQPADQVPSDIAGRVTHTVHDGGPGIVLEDRNCLELGPEPMTARGIRQSCLPTVQGIVIAMADERTDAGLVEPVETVDEPALSPQAAVGAVVDVSRYEKRVHPFRDTEIDDVVIGIEGRLPKTRGNMLRHTGLQARKRAVEMQIGGVYETKRLHGLP
jgi:hypothetical protein